MSGVGARRRGRPPFRRAKAWDDEIVARVTRLHVSSVLVRHAKQILGSHAGPGHERIDMAPREWIDFLGIGPERAPRRVPQRYRPMPAQVPSVHAGRVRAQP